MEMLFGFFFGCFLTAILGVSAIIVAIKNSMDGLQ